MNNPQGDANAGNEMKALPTPVLTYLRNLEREAKHRVGVVPETILEDAREFLTRDFQSLHDSEPGLTDDEVYSHFEDTYGTPSDVAESYLPETQPTSRIPGYAPGWRICCTRCGKSAPAAKVGITRVAARSHHKYIGGWCKDCRWPRWMRLVQDLDDDNLTRQLSVGETGETVRKKLHRPWLTVAAILLITFSTIVVGNALVRPLLAQVVGDDKSKSQSAANDVKNRFSELPSNWKLDRKLEVPVSQLAGFSQKLGGTLNYLSNNFLSSDGKKIQINVMQASDAGEAEKVYASLSSIKGGNQTLVRQRDVVYEFVVRNREEALLAIEARYALGIQPKQQSYRVKFAALPIASGKAMSWNSLYNLFLQWEESSSPQLVRRIETLAGDFQVSNKIRLAHLSLPEKSIWKFSTKPTERTANEGEASVAFSFSELNKKAGVPIVGVEGNISCETYARWKSVDPNDEQLVTATEAWPVQAAEVQALAREIYASQKSSSDKLSALLGWFAEERNMRFGGNQAGSRYGTLVVLKNRLGHCWDYSDLFITLARAGGIPARQVTGWLYPREGHVWCQVLIDGEWRSVDPTTGLECGSDYVPFTISNEGRLPFVFASSVIIEAVQK